MNYLLISISHKNTDLAIRENLAFDTQKQDEILRDLMASNAICEAVILVTCNRIELIMSTKDSKTATNHALYTLHKASGVDLFELEGRAEIYEEEGAARHLFSVASGLESVVIGEAQIVGQFKDAFKFALEHGYAHKRLTGLMNHAIRCAAAVRNATEVGKNPVSVSSAAVVQARSLMDGSLEGVEAVVVGTGEMSRLATLHLLGDGAVVTVIGRDIEKARQFAQDIGANVKYDSFAKLAKLINTHKLLFSATGAPHTVIGQDMVEEREFKRFWFDIAVPRDIDRIEDQNITIFSVDDLKTIVQTNMSLREEEASKAYKVVGEYVGEFFAWLNSLSADPIIKALREKASEAAREELNRVIKKGFIPKEYEENARLLLHNAFKRFLHIPTITLRTTMEKDGSSELLEATKNIFHIEGI